MTLSSIDNVIRDEYVTWSWISEGAALRCRGVHNESDHGLASSVESEYLRLRDCCRVSLLREEHYPLLDKAVDAWRKAATRVQEILNIEFQNIGDAMTGTGPEFEQWFANVQTTAHGNDISPKQVRKYAHCFYHLKGFVSNIMQCESFAVFLPQSVQQRRIEIAKIGRMMTRVFYLATLGKQLDRIALNDGYRMDHSIFDRMELYLRIVEEILAGTWRPVP
jgi:hypothetical protein